MKELKINAEMVGDIRHNVNNPLTIIKAVAQCNLRDMKRGNFGSAGELEDDLEKIVAAVNRIHEYVESLQSEQSE